uniref:Putative Aminodeoxychorismate lyase n=1 Tax=mine drainage metagenome TaxID=410659 RepID=E6PRG2_9ZZZZ
MKTRWPVRLFLLGLTAGLLAFALFAYWALAPMRLSATPLDFSVKPGSTARAAAAQIRTQGADLSPRLFYWLARLSGQGTQLKAGSYEIEQGTSPWQLLQKMARGDQSLLAVTVPEGWTFAQFLQALNLAPGLDHDAAGLSDAQIMQRIGAPPNMPPEGWFFPDTYLYARNSSELTVLKRAYHAMQRQLTSAWDAREPGLPLQTPYQALILASVVEKETGSPSDRSKIAGVFINRLRNGMPLQSDPTVIYALGTRYTGALTRKNLQTGSPFNTYVHAGLPPTPIALPGDAALQAVLHPAATQALYFVARGDGSSAFSDTLAEHNAAVDRYILKRSP